ncbi:sulfite exporter TauE/SafE family protein [bacterium]|nr:sulfite exporter TauE/SafE family protein [bacterium]
MSSIDPLVWVFLATGFTVGFGHCIGMCGPIVISLSLNLRTANTTWPHLLYNAGRLTTYTLLGGIMGATGSFTMVTSRIADVQKGVLIFSGVLIVVMGLMMSGWLTRIQCFGDHSRLQSFLAGGYGRLIRSKSIAAYYPIGLLLGLLPCGPVYTALIAAARAGMEASSMQTGFVKGMILLLAFGLGTVPALLLVGKLAGLKWLTRRSLIYKIGALTMIVMGGYFIIKGIQF